jgi:hypothetical protein
MAGPWLMHTHLSTNQRYQWARNARFHAQAWNPGHASTLDLTGWALADVLTAQQSLTGAHLSYVLHWEYCHAWCTRCTYCCACVHNARGWVSEMILGREHTFACCGIVLMSSSSFGVSQVSLLTSAPAAAAAAGFAAAMSAWLQQQQQQQRHVSTCQGCTVEAFSHCICDIERCSTVHMLIGITSGAESHGEIIQTQQQ